MSKAFGTVVLCMLLATPAFGNNLAISATSKLGQAPFEVVLKLDVSLVKEIKELGYTLVDAIHKQDYQGLGYRAGQVIGLLNKHSSVIDEIRKLSDSELEAIWQLDYSELEEIRRLGDAQPKEQVQLKEISELDDDSLVKEIKGLDYTLVDAIHKQDYQGLGYRALQVIRLLNKHSSVIDKIQKLSDSEFEAIWSN